MVFFENYFYPNQQMPTPSGFRDDFFIPTTLLSGLRSITFHISSLNFQLASSLKTKFVH